ncbi:MAG: hypothetical protein ABF820_09335 [Sporolactobacillus sp.]
MSFVSIVAGLDWVSIVSDDHLIEGADKITVGSKANFFQISEAHLIACTGSARLYNQLKKDYPFQKHSIAINDEMLESIQAKIDRIPGTEQDRLVTVIELIRPVHCWLLSNQPNGQRREVTGNAQRLATLFMGSRAIDLPSMKRLVAQFNYQLDGVEKTPDSIYSAQKWLLNSAAQFDQTIGKKLFHARLICRH